MGDDATLQVFIVSGVMNVALAVLALIFVDDRRLAWGAGVVLGLIGAGLIAVGVR